MRRVGSKWDRNSCWACLSFTAFRDAPSRVKGPLDHSRVPFDQIIKQHLSYLSKILHRHSSLSRDPKEYSFQVTESSDNHVLWGPCSSDDSNTHSRSKATSFGRWARSSSDITILSTEHQWWRWQWRFGLHHLICSSLWLLWRDGSTFAVGPFRTYTIIQTDRSKL